MTLTPEQTGGLDLVLNEARIVGLRVHMDRCTAAVAIEPLAAPAHERIEIRLSSVSRVTASYRTGPHDGSSGPSQIPSLTVNQMLDIMQSFGGEPVWGARFFDVPDDAEFARFLVRPSLDVSSDCKGASHTLTIFQESFDPSRYLVVRFWFDVLFPVAADEQEIGIEEIADEARRYWEALERRPNDRR